MKITGIKAYQVDLPLKEGKYSWSGGKAVSVFDSTIVAIETDSGLIGYGETCPLGPAYLPSYAPGVRTGLTELGPQLLGADPTKLGPLNQLMDQKLKGHPYVKSAIDMACWDILGKATNQPVSLLLGGRYGSKFPLYRAISKDTPDQMVKMVKHYYGEGYRKFQLKVGDDPILDIERVEAVRKVLKPGDVLIADANTGWLKHDAMRFVRGVKDLDVYVEQPCASYEACLSVRNHSPMPFILDESIDSVTSLLRANEDHAMDVVNIKISKFGGLTKAKFARDLAVELGLGVTIEDTWGGDIVTSAIAHLAHSTPPEHLFSATDFNNYVSLSFMDGVPLNDKGFMAASTAPGLGVNPKLDVLGNPVIDLRK